MGRKDFLRIASPDMKIKRSKRYYFMSKSHRIDRGMLALGNILHVCMESHLMLLN